mgnify:CR=1 FL=1
MKKIYIFLVLLFTVSFSFGQVLTENFSYTAGQLLTANGWSAHSGAGTNAITVTAPGLTYSGHPGSGVGNATTMTTSGEDVNRTFTAISSGSAYMSFLLNVSAAQTGGDYFIGLFQTSSIFPLRIYAKSDGAGGYFLGISKATGAITYEATSRTFGTTYFIVANYIFNTATTTDDVVNLWVNPALGGSETTATIANVTGAVTDGTSAAAIYLRQGAAGNASTQQIDAILVGSTWEDVTPSGAATPSLSASALTNFNNVCINTEAGPNSFTITGTNLTTANVTVAALPGFTYSTTSGGTYTTSLSLTQPGGAYSQQVFVKFNPTAAQSYSGNIVVAGGGASSSVNVAAAGAGVNSTPTVTSGAASAITLNSATVAGSISANGCSSVTAYGIEYSTTAGFTNGTGTAVVSTNLSGGNFTSALGSLTQGTTYYYHAYATNSGGTAYGAEMSFTTATPNPAITTTALAAFGNVCINTTGGPNSFTINGTNLTTANVTVAALPGFTYSTTSGGTYTTTLSLTQTGGTYSQQIFVKFDPTAVQSYNGNIVVNGGGITAAVNVAASGAGINTLPTVTAGTPTAIAQTTATVPGTISANGCSTVTAYGIEYSTTAGFANGTGTAVPSTNLSGNNFSSALSALTAGTTYYYHAYATNGAGTSYSTEGSFTTTTVSITGIVISQVYGAGGNAGATYIADYVELFNRTTSSISLPVGYTLQYTSATGTGNWNVAPLPAITIPAGGYYLVQVSANGANGIALPAVDHVTTPALNMAAAAGKIALVNGTTALSGCPTASNYIDLVGFGTTANCFEGTGPTGNISTILAAFRKNNGCTETNDNSADFEILAPAPRNSATTANVCGAAVPALSATALTAFGNVCINTEAGPNSFTITGTNLTTANVAVAALPGFTYSTTSGGTYTATLSLTQPGGAYSQQVFVKFNPTAVQSYNGNIVVSGGGASASVNVAANGAGINTLPSVASGAASAITLNSATVAGSITANGCSSVTAYGIEYSTTAGFANGTGTAIVSTNLSGGNFTSALGSLTQGTTYYYHAYATNSGGTSYGTELSFTTATPNPAITTTALAAFGNVCINTTGGPNSFTINGTNLTTANVTVAALPGFTYSTTSGGTYTTTLSLTQTGGTYSQQIFVKFDPTAVQSYNGNIVVNGGGITAAVNVAASGAGINTLPTVSGGAASAITQTTATVAGSISANGCSAVTVYGIEYSTTPGFANGTGTAVASTNLAGGNFSSALSALTAGTTYYYHAYATNGAGTSYSTESSFTTTSTTPTTGGVVISQVYGGGGNASATYNQDFVELFNRSTNTVDISGWSIQYASATGPTGSGNWAVTTIPSSTTIAPGKYYLIALATGATGIALPTPDFTNTGVNLSGTAGKVALVNNNTPLNGTTACSGATVVDVLGYGTTATCGEGTVLNPTGIDNTKSMFRKNNGCVETNDNSADFEVLLVLPRNSATAANLCGAAVPSLTATALTAFGNVCINTTAGPNSFTITGTNLTAANVAVAALPGFTYSTTSGGTYTSTLTLTQAGGSFSQQVFVRFTPVAVQSYSGNIVVSGGGASSPVNVAASGAGINTLPAVTSGAASAITINSATVAGSISSDGCSAVTAYGIEYSTTPGFVNGTGTAVASTNLASGNFSSALSGLAQGVTYYYHAYATNGGGTAYGAELSFTTLSPNPLITATALTAFGNICINTTGGPNSFTLNGTNLTNANIVVGPLAGYTFSTTSGGTYTASLTLTQAGGTYTQQVFVRFTPTAVQSYNGNIPVTGGGTASTTNVAASGAGVNMAATVTTGTASAITTSSATLAGSITAIGCSAVTVYGIEYSITNGFPNGTGTQVASTNVSGGNFSSAVSGLAASTTYYYHAYATNAGGTTYGAQQSFTTASPTLNVTALTAFGAVCTNTTAGPNSFVISSTGLGNGAVTVAALAGYTYSTTSGGTYTATLSLPNTGGAFNQAVFVKFTPTAVQSYNGNIVVSGGGAAAVNVAASGSGVNTTPVVVTGTATGITTSSVVLAGSTTGAGCSVITEVGFEYSGINGFTPGNGTKVVATTNTSFTASVTGLVQGGTYYFRAYAKNAGGTTYGDQQTFTIASIADEFVVYPVPVRRGQDFRFSMTNLTPGYYGLLFYNSAGALVYQHNMNIQVNFINQSITIPATLTTGTYRVQLVDYRSVVATKSIIIAE